VNPDTGAGRALVLQNIEICSGAGLWKTSVDCGFYGESVELRGYTGCTGTASRKCCRIATGCRPPAECGIGLHRAPCRKSHSRWDWESGRFTARIRIGMRITAAGEPRRATRRA